MPGRLGDTGHPADSRNLLYLAKSHSMILSFYSSLGIYTKEISQKNTGAFHLKGISLAVSRERWHAGETRNVEQKDHHRKLTARPARSPGVPA